MRARQLIGGAAFGPEALKAIGQAVDEAWAEIAGNFGNVPTSTMGGIGSPTRSYRSQVKTVRMWKC
jgi:hypothetical protein